MSLPPGLFAWLRRLATLGLGLLRAIVWVLAQVFSYRGLCLCFLALMAWLTLSGWLRPPLSNDISAFRLPLLANRPYDPTPAAQLYGPRAFVALSPGVVVLALLVVGAVVAVRRPERFNVAAGLLLCGLLGCVAAVLVNHPELVSLLDDQLGQRKQLVAVLAGTTEPPLRITDDPRVEDSADPLYERDTLLRGAVYLHTHRFLLLMLPALACLLATRGTLGRRVGHLAGWSLAGVAFALMVTFPRLSAEWRWGLASRVEWRGDLEAAERHADAALVRFPEFARLERTWVLRGRIDYRRGRTTPAASYFHAYQWAQNKEWLRAIAEVEDLAKLGEPAPLVNRWLANMKSQLAIGDFHGDRFQAAEDGWQAACEVDATPSFRPLLVATLRARSQRHDPGASADLVDPFVAQLRGDRLMRAALLAMVGDSFFKAGQFAEARARYEKSIAAYNLPKHVNFRAQRGLQGM
jgi:hypothetical protein